jgi:hypothetical protein
MGDKISRTTYYPKGHRSGKNSETEYFSKPNLVTTTTSYPKGHRSGKISETDVQIQQIFFKIKRKI